LNNLCKRERVRKKERGRERGRERERERERKREIIHAIFFFTKMLLDTIETNSFLLKWLLFNEKKHFHDITDLLVDKRNIKQTIMKILFYNTTLLVILSISHFMSL